MTLLNHIGVYAILLIVVYAYEILRTDSELHGIYHVIIPPIAAAFFFVIFEAFYWTLNIFFLK